MLRILGLLIKLGDRLYVTVATLFMIILVAAVSAGIIARYFFNSPFPWTEELVVFLFIWIAFLGAAVASARHKHVVVDVITARFSPSKRNLVGVITDVLTLVFVTMVIIGSVILIPQSTHTSVALDIPRSLYYTAVFASAVLIFLVYLESIILKLRELSGKNKEITT